MRDRLLTGPEGLVVLLIATVLLYAPALGGAFVFDDYPEIVWNRDLAGGPWTALAHNPFRPLTYALYWVLYQVGVLQPTVYHAANIILHGVCVALVWDVMRRCVERIDGSASTSVPIFTAAFFALHPLATENVAGIAGLPMLLASVFALLSVRGVVRSLETGKGRHAELALLWFACALLTKETHAALPLVLYGVHRILQPDVSHGHTLRRVAPFLLLAFAAAGARIFYPAELGVFTEGLTPASFRATQPWVLALYGGKSLWPLHLTVDYDVAVVTAMTDVRLWGGLAVVGGLAYALWRTRGTLAMALLLWMAAAMLPTSSVIPFSDVARENRVYFALIGFAGLMGVSLAWIYENARTRRYAIVIGAVLCVCFAVLTGTRATVWGDARGEALWKEAVRVSPGKARAHYNYGNRLRERDAYAQAEREYRAALALNPRLAQAHTNLGLVLLATERPEEAIRSFRAAVYAAPADADAQVNLAAAALKLGRMAEARAHLAKAEALIPGDSRVIKLRGLMGDRVNAGP